MLNSQTNPESVQEVPAGKNTITLEEFLENGLEGYEYIKGELAPISLPSMIHGEISVNVIRYLDMHVYTHQLGRLYTAGTTFHLGDSEARCCVCFDGPITRG